MFFVCGISAIRQTRHFIPKRCLSQLASPSKQWRNPDESSPFFVSRENGFLPKNEPLASLPEKFNKLNEILEEMPLVKDDGTPGLLHHGKLGEKVHKELPFWDVSQIQDKKLLSALYRDYTFLASAYLLEPCDINYRKRKEYGLARKVLPENIAVPLETVSEKIGAKPFMEYAMSYCLYNYTKKDNELPISFDNLKLIRKFSGCESETGFILVHVAMVAHSGKLVNAALETLDGAFDKNRQLFDQGLTNYRDVMCNINQEMETMWSRSIPKNYLSFRTFIMGSKNQPMFPDGIIYEGSKVSAEPRYYRGESGANDSIIPMSDNLFEITRRIPNNPLTRTLKDFRQYRPVNHHKFVDFVQQKAEECNIASFAEQDPNSTTLYLENLDWIRAFRHRHWLFTKEYIIKHTRHPVATGGSPIITWLPNQLGAVLETIEGTIERRKHELLEGTKITPQNQEKVKDIWERVKAEHRVLKREVEQLKQLFPNQDKFQE